MSKNLKMGEFLVLQAIEKTRLEMYSLIELEGLLSLNTIKKSQELDKLLNINSKGVKRCKM